MNTKSRTLLFIVFVLLVGIIVVAQGTFQNPRRSGMPSEALQKADEDFYTLADYALSEPTDPQQKALRKVRARRDNMRADRGINPLRFQITEERGNSFGGPSTHAPIEPALPAAQSDLVMVGEVLEASAFLTEDRTGVFSEFRVRVTNVLKNNSAAPVFGSDSVSITRGGGGVRFPSGRVIRSGHHGKPLPRVGHKYLFFLRYNKDGGLDYAIITGYEIRGRHVVPLDGVNLADTVEPAYAEYQKYSGADEASFLSEVFDAIARNLGGEPVRGRSVR